MARIYPFRAWRYNPALVSLQNVVTQPYDKISPSMQQSYYQRSPQNLVRVILGLPELFDNAENNVYTRAAQDFSSWRANDILIQDTEPSVFAYSQQYRVPGTDVIRERRGFIGLGELCDYSQGIVHRHEQTLAKPKGDRLRLLQATRAHFGQIFMLYSDPVHTVEKLLFGNSHAPHMEVTDEYGVIHRVWRVSDPATLNLLLGAMQDKKLIIADGHHRYETALNYSREHAPKDGTSTRPHESATSALPQPAYPEAAAMMTFVNMDSEGLTILPTHRVVFGLANFDADAFLARAGEFFDVQALPGNADAVALQQKLTEAGDHGISFVAITRQGKHLLTARQKAMDAALAALPERQRHLDVVQLHKIVLERLLGISEQAILEQTHLRYLRDTAEAVQQVAGGEADVAFLMNPAKLDQLREVAFAGDVMPQKSTDFYPKLLSGLTIYALD
ncbi:MAG TPA: DUF1015 domain-containing protein [Acidobacteriaceae bacterium]|jgi:uncharacterized protein (DUF1015 family)|nr:DUF1015 domain-containing protein [Acidobacteriaceae bacterium]